MSIVPDKNKKKVTSKEIGNYVVSMDSGNEDFIDLIYSLWTPDNPKGLDRYDLCYAMCTFLCYNMYIENDKDYSKLVMRHTICEALIYGWRKEGKSRSKDLDVAEIHLGIDCKEGKWTLDDLLKSMSTFVEMVKGFNPMIWEEVKLFLLWASEVTDIEYVE